MTTMSIHPDSTAPLLSSIEGRLFDLEMKMRSSAFDIDHTTKPRKSCARDLWGDLAELRAARRELAAAVTEILLARQEEVLTCR